MNYCQPWPERRDRRVPCPQFWSFFTTVCPDFTTSEQKSQASCQPTSAPNMHEQCQIVLSTCTNYELLSALTWNKGQKGVLSSVLAFFHHCVPRFPHIWTEVSSKLSTNIWIETTLSMSNCPFHMYQLWTVISSDLKQGSEGCPVLSFGIFSPLCAQISPHLNWSLQKVVNQHLHRNNIANVKLSFLYVPTMNYYQLWPERRVRRVSCPQFWPFFTTVRPKLPTSELKSPASCQPTSAWKQCY